MRTKNIGAKPRLTLLGDNKRITGDAHYPPTDQSQHVVFVLAAIAPLPAKLEPDNAAL